MKYLCKSFYHARLEHITLVKEKNSDFENMN